MARSAKYVIAAFLRTDLPSRFKAKGQQLRISEL